MKNKKGFTLIELIVVIAILGILALFLIPSFMGYSRDAKIQMMKANVKTGQNAYMYAWTKYEDEEKDKANLVEKMVCENLKNTACYFLMGDQRPSMTEYPRYVFTVGILGLQGSYITYYLDKDNFCSYSYAQKGSENKEDYWICSVNGVSLPTEVVK